jgi:hypothetical protein
MAKIDIVCSNCGITFQREKSQYDNGIRKGWRVCCSTKCVGQVSIPNLGPLDRGKPAIPFHIYIHTARVRQKEKVNLQVDIDSKYLSELWDKQKGICPYTRIKLYVAKRKQKDNDHRYLASLDRIDSSKGYIKGNVQFVSTSINYMKNKMTDQQTKEFINEIISNYEMGNKN